MKNIISPDLKKSNVTATTEEVLKEREAIETQRILDEMRVPWEQMDLIKLVYYEASDNEVSPVSGILSVYELGRIHGIRAERKRRVKTLTA